MDWQSAALRLLARPRVLHRATGRLRIHLPFLKLIKEEKAGFVPMLSALLCVPEGLESIDPCLATGNVMVRYDAARLTETEILDYLKSIAEICIRYKDRFKQVPPDKLADVTGRLEVFLRSAVTYPLALDPQLEIPDHVLT